MQVKHLLATGYRVSELLNVWADFAACLHGTFCILNTRMQDLASYGLIPLFEIDIALRAVIGSRVVTLCAIHIREQALALAG